MNSLAIVTEGTFSNLCPIVYPDLIQNSGTLAIWDGNLDQLSAVPANNGTLNNRAWKSAVALLGSGNQAGMAFSFFKPGTVPDTQCKMELTGKKCLHAMNSQTAQSGTTGTFTGIRLPEVLRAYMAANPTHRFIVSIWGRITRVALVDSAALSQAVGSSSTPNVNYHYQMKNGLIVPNGSGKVRGNLGTGSIRPLGGFVANVEVSALTGTLTGTYTVDVAAFHAATGWQVSTLNKESSWVLERAVIEDATVSGRSWADFDALDYQMWQDAHASGGRLYGDTNSDPATTLP